MDQVSRPFQIVLVLVLGFAGVWFVALRPKTDTGAGGAPASAPAAQTPATPQSDAAPAQKKSAIPGGLGNAVDKARAAKTQGDADAATRSAKVDAKADPQPQNTTATPVQAPPAKAPVSSDAASSKSATKTAGGATALVQVGGVTYGLLTTGLDRTAAAKALAKADRQSRPGFATPAKVRAALAKNKVVVLLFFQARSADDRAVRGELAAVDRHHGRVKAWAVSVRGLPRFKNVMSDVEVLQSPTVVVLSRHADPYMFPGFTTHAEIDQATSVALRRKRG
jgi:hypothetical protein